jgi:hypothetical protein
MDSRATIPKRNQNAAARPAYSCEPPWVASTDVSIELTAARPIADPKESAPLKMAPIVPAMDEGAAWKMAML